MIITLTGDESHRKNDHIHLNHHHHHHHLDFQPDQPEEDAETRKGIHNHEVKGEGGDDDMMVMIMMMVVMTIMMMTIMRRMLVCRMPS